MLTHLLFALTLAAEAIDPILTLDRWWVIVSFALPFVYPFIVKAGAAEWFRWALSMALAVGVAVLSALGLDWSVEVTAELLITRGFFVVGIVQTVYKAADLLVKNWIDENGRSLGEQAVFLPDRGLSVGANRS